MQDFLHNYALGLKSLSHGHFSPIRGPEGNIEFLLWLKNAPGEVRYGEAEARGVVAAAYDKFITTAENA